RADGADEERPGGCGNARSGARRGEGVCGGIVPGRCAGGGGEREDGSGDRGTEARDCEGGAGGAGEGCGGAAAAADRSRVHDPRIWDGGDGDADRGSSEEGTRGGDSSHGRADAGAQCAGAWSGGGRGGGGTAYRAERGEP